MDRGASADSERVRRFYDRAAPRYDRSIRLFERLLFGDGRRWVCSQAAGEVLELGVGTGRSLPYYAPDVRLTGIDLSPAMLAIARRRAGALGRPVDLQLGDAQALEFPAERFDAVVCTLALCTIPDERRAVAEARRVLRIGGQLLFLEHVRSPRASIRLGQCLLEPLMVRLGKRPSAARPAGLPRNSGLRRRALRALHVGHRRAGPGPPGRMTTATTRQPPSGGTG
jgi:ubiquinone/menaquinone biosynthesis C-methylase UbiE